MAKQDILDQYEIPDSHCERMMTMLGHGGDNNLVLPVDVRRKYIEMRILSDRIGMPISDMHLWTIVACATTLEVPEPEQPKISELWAKKKVQAGTPVLCTLGKETGLKGVLITVDNQNRSIVQLEGGDERKFTDDKVMLGQ